ncbi:GNAT family N-acetyltransferase [Marivibrio halodurans]|uniref:GNAT family N-acetyltransferase n=1 Tax=Marivibrio halodurans TaxID=2039722 RepID=A0A8J7SL37_9PROT|nr:GNAT family N-acetyltransferase [Marivibrio halodurans]MBP5858863.1 GNAT family N-acetyltransferase [Marivibrio halodurans]
MSFTIRDATEADRPTLTRFMAALQEVERALHPSRRPGAAMAADHLDHLLGKVADHLGCCLIAEASGEEGGAAIAFLIGFVEEDEGHYLTVDYAAPAHISDLYVVVDWRGRGVAEAMMEAAEAHFRALGVRRMTISYVAGNEPAARAYEKRGFAPYLQTLVKPLS